MRLGLLYALGHAAMIALLGDTVILFQLSLPSRMNLRSEQLVGITLIVLAIYANALIDFRLVTSPYWCWISDLA